MPTENRRPEWTTWYASNGSPVTRYLPLHGRDEIVLTRRAELNEWFVETKLLLTRQTVNTERIITDAELREQNIAPVWDEVQNFVAEMAREWLAELNVHAVKCINTIAKNQRGAD